MGTQPACPSESHTGKPFRWIPLYRNLNESEKLMLLFREDKDCFGRWVLLLTCFEKSGKIWSAYRIRRKYCDEFDSLAHVEQTVQKLVARGFIDETPGGLYIHDWEQHALESLTQEVQREKWAESQRNYRAAKKQSPVAKTIETPKTTPADGTKSDVSGMSKTCPALE